ncbi:MAG: hypothetical protein ACTS5A_02360 [Candidatus Hodgkinia cicadicola]
MTGHLILGEVYRQRLNKREGKTQNNSTIPTLSSVRELKECQHIPPCPS